MHGDLIVSLASITFVEHCCFLLCWGYLGASLLVMIEEFAVIWLNLVENCVFVAVSLECAPTVIYLELFACGLTVPLALKAVQVQLVNVVAWVVPVKQGYHCYL